MAMGMVFLGVLVFINSYLGKIEEQKLEETQTYEAKVFVHSFKTAIIQNLDSLDRLAGRFAGENVSYKKSWEKDVASYYKDFKSFRSLMWVNSTGDVKWSYPEEDFNGQELKLGEKYSDAIIYASEKLESAFTYPVNNRDGTKVFSSLHPTMEGASVSGFILGVYEIERLIQLYGSKNLNKKILIAGRIGFDGFSNENIYHQFKKNKEFSFSIRNIEFRVLTQPVKSILTSFNRLNEVRILILCFIYFVGMVFICLTINYRAQIDFSNSRYKLMTDAVNANALVSETDSKGVITYANKKFQDVSKYSGEELVGQDHRLLNSGEHSREYMKSLWDTINSGKIWEGEIKNKAKDGSFYWVSSTIFPKKDKNNNVTGFVSIRYDVSERMKQRAELKEKNSYLNLALESANLGIWDWYFIDDSVKFDERWAHMLGLDFSKIVMELNTWKSRVHPEDLNECMTDIKNYLDGKTEIYQNIHRMKHENGDWIYILDQGKISEWDKDGNPVRFTGTHYDITAQKIQEQHLKEEKVKAQQAEKAKTEFLANMSHEIRTPMNGVLGTIQLLSETDLTPKQVEMVNTARSCGDSLLSILNDILDISKIESGKFDLELVDFNLRSCIEEALFLLSYKASSKKIDLIFKDDTNRSLWFKGDVTRIRQIIVNFLSNAVKFTEVGAVTIEILLNESDTKGLTKVDIKVTDTGIGIAKDSQGKLFSAFSQADNSTTRKFGGTGLGLSICFKLAQIMGGTVFLESEEGVGSTFTASIPLLSVREPEKKVSSLIDTHDDDLSLEFPHKILVADDNAVNQKLAKMMLDKLGYDCDLAGNGIEAIKALENASYSIVFMDMQMPEMDGVEATLNIIEKYGAQAPPIIAMTANVFPEDKEKCRSAGMVDFVGKPIRVDELRRVLMRYGDKKQKSA